MIKTDIYKEARYNILNKLKSFIKDVGAIKDDSNLIEYGLNSIQIMQLSTMLRKIGIKISFSKMISNPNLKSWLSMIKDIELTKDIKVRNKKETLNNDSPFNLTDVQYAYWIGRQDDQPMGGVGCHAYLEFDGENINSNKIEDSWNKVQMHHQMLRMKFLEDGTQKEMEKPYSKNINLNDLREEDESLIDGKLEKIRTKLSHRKLKVQDGQVAGLTLTLMPKGKTRIHLDIDLLIADVQSLSIIIRDLSRIYSGQEFDNDEAFKFRTYLSERKDQIEEKKKEASIYWKGRLDKMPGAPALPLKTKPEMMDKPFFRRRKYFVDKLCWEKIKKNSAMYKTTPAMVLLSVYALVLERWSSQPDFLINIPLFNREEDNEKIKNAVADFTNLLLLEVHSKKNMTFLEMLNQIQNQFYNSAENSAYSGVEVQRDLAKLHLGEHFLAPVVFACNIGTPLATSKDEEILGNLNYMISQTPQVWLDFQVYEKDGGVLLTWDAVDELFPKNMIDDMFLAYRNSLEMLKENKAWELVIDVLPKNQIDMRENDIKLVLNKPKKNNLLYSAFLENAEKFPGKVALINSVTGEKISYKDLLEKSLNIAGMLKSCGVKEGDFVAVTLPRGIKQVEAILGILMAGSCYVPVSIDQPNNRRNKIHKKIGIKYVLTNDKFKKTITWSNNLKVISIENLMKYKALDEPIDQSTEDSAYIIMTSGSTGEPKGVEVSHCSALNTIDDINKKYNVSYNDSILSVSSIDFDLSVYDIFGLLSKGGTVILNTDETKKDANHWINIIKKYNVTIWNSVPILLDMLVTMVEGEDEKLSLRVVMLSGDWIGLDLPKRLFKVCLNCNLIAMGGATEASIWSNYFDITVPIPKNWKSIPYGRSLTNQTYKVVDSKGRDCPNWVPGELWIGGLGVVKGYKGDEDLSKKKFIKKDNIRWYKTGDMGKFWEDGTIEFLGRIDYQVKIKGHRIELGEIETAINKVKGVEKSLVRKQVKDKHEYLLSYIIPKIVRDDSKFIKEIQCSLENLIPSYMIPESFMFLDEFPLTSNGKIDYKALPLDDKKDVDEDININNTKTEEFLLGIWKDAFKNTSINKYKNFFEIGGDSLSATKICANINKYLGININISIIFEKLTIESIAKEVDYLKSKKEIEFIHKIQQDEVSHYKPFPLTDVQHAYLVGRSGAYDFGKTSSHFYYEMDCKDIDINCLEDSFNKLIKEHDALRMIVLEDNLNQKILENVSHYEIETYDLRNMSIENQEKRITKIREEMSKQVLDIYKWPIFDIRYSIISDNKRRIHISFDNMILDGWSIIYLLNEWTKLYNNPKLEVLTHDISYRDYVLGLQQIKESIQYRKSKEYWLNKLDDIYNAPELPIKNGFQFHEETVFKRYGGKINKADWDILKEKAKFYDITPSIVLLAAFSEVLYRWSKKSEFTINLTLFNKIPMHKGLESIVGDFTSLMLLSIKAGENNSFVDKCHIIQQKMAQNYGNLYFDGVEVQRELAKSNNTLKSAVMPVVFTSTLGAIDSSYDLLGKLNYGITQTPQVWLDHQIREEKEELLFNWDVIEDLFPKGLIDDMFQTYRSLINNLVKKDYLWSENKNTLINVPNIKIIEKVNETKKCYKETTLLNMFEKNIKSNGDKEAIITWDKTLSYNECNKLSNIVSQKIKDSSNCVAIIMEKSIEQIISAIAVMKSGKAYLPIDIGNPVERIEKIITSSKVNTIITKQRYCKKLSNILNVNIIFIDIDLEDKNVSSINDETVNLKKDNISSKDIAYVIYTSGSTGMPKGVMIQHKAAANTILDINDKYKVNGKDKTLALSNLAFDLSVYDIFGMFQSGGSIVMPSSNEIRNPHAWIKMMEENNITIWNSVPMFMEMLLEYLKTNSKYIEKIQTLRLVLLSGDWISKDLPQRIKNVFKNARVICLGGGTEASIWSNYYEPEGIKDDWISIPYGYPLANQQYHVLNKDMLDCPNYVPGEIYISGEGLAKGYLNEGNLTKERFPISKRLDKRLYKTGDIGKYETDGTLLFLGREDAQVKINGYRVELGEIESALTQLSYVESSVAMIDDKSKLITFIVPKDNSLNDIESKILDEISEKLPDYCIPSNIFVVKKFPLNSNGKIDRKQLKKSIKGREKDVSKENVSGTLEVLILKIWKEILGVEDIYSGDEFFKIGGDSLKAIRIVAEINKKIDNTDLEISDLFIYPTIKKLASYIEEKNKKSENSLTEGVL